MALENDWQNLYQAAVLETDWAIIEERIKAVESAVEARLHEFSLDHGGTPEENQAIINAVTKLNILRADVARWRESKGKG
jgi:hypothetical protein